jgi:DNA-binding beta-propeller fold protein YncE
MNRNTTVTLSLALLACAILVGLACAGAPASASISPATTPITIDVDLPSDSTGTPGGALALRIFAPASAGAARYAAGAPVLIYVPGGTDAGTLRPALQQADDVIRIVFLFPGGSDSRTGRRSDGTYDYRGADSIAALGDVIRYAAGELTDAAGHTIDDVVPVPVLHDNIGLLGTSNGGNIIVAVAAEHGSQLAGHLRYIVQWESPVSSQIATVDLGRVNLDCTPGQRQSLLAVNPRYLSYGPLTLEVDYSQLTYDAGDALHPVFFDGTGDGHYTTVLDPHTGCRTPDLNLNGALELNEDFPLTAYTDGVKHYYSRPVPQALTALFDPPSQQAPNGSSEFPRVPRSSPEFPRPKGTRRNSEELGGSHGNSGELGGIPWPPDIATPPEAAAFWDLREAVRQYPGALADIPDLEGMVLTSLVDHVQTAPDHPHIHQAFDGWDGNGAWVKINPARDYVLEVDPSLSSRTDLPDNAANTAPADWTDAGSYAFPDGLEETYFAAAVHEMADRAHAAPGPTATPSATLTATSTPTPIATPTSTPMTGAPTRWHTLSLNELHGWTPEMDNHLKIFDVGVDETRNRVYVMGIMTAGIAVIDGETDTLIGSVDSGRSEANPGRTYLAVHPTTGVIYVANWHAQTLRMVDPDTGTVTGPVALPGDPFDVVVDSAQNRVYVSMRTFGKVGVYDATSLAEVAVIDLGANRIGGLALDSAANRLYVVDSDAPDAANQSRLYVINTDTLTPLSPIPFDNPFGPPANFADVDPASGRTFVTTSDHLFILAPDGSIQRLVGLPADSKAPIYWSDTGKVYVVSRDGISPIESTVSVIDAATGHLDQTVALGTGGAQHAALNRVTGKLYTAGMEYTDVVVFDTATNSVAGSVDIGNSVEDIVTAPSDGTAYFANRLGGSTVIAYRPDTGEWGEFEAGGWPVDLDVDEALNRLYVLSHYAGTVSAFDLSSDTLNPTLLAAVPLGLTDHDDALSSMALDATHHRLITTHPEHDSIVVVDGDSLSVAATISDLPSFTYNPNGTAGPGHLQPAVDEGLNKLYVLVSRAERVDVFDGDAGYAYERTIDLSGYPWEWQADFDDNYIWVDSTRHRLYVGPLIIDTTTDAYAGQLPAGAGQVVVGVDEAANLLYTIGVEPAPGTQALPSTSARRAQSPILRLRSGQVSSPQDTRRKTQDARRKTQDTKHKTQDTRRKTQDAISNPQPPEIDRLYAIDRNTFAVETQTDLREVTYYVPPYFALDVDRARFYAGYMQRAEVDIYTLDGAAATPTPTATPTATPSPPASQCMGDVNSNGVGDVVDIMATASDLPCHIYLPLVAARWHQPWPTPAPPPSADVTFLIADPLPDMPIRPLLGVNAGPAPVGAPGNADLTTAYQDIGVTMVRNHDFYGRLDMAVLYPDRTKDPNDRASFDFTASDAAFAAIVEGGFEPYFRIGDSWSNATPPANASERANWVQAAVNVVRHYREGLWNGFDANIRYAEIWNEPDFVQFWPQPHTRLEFFQLYEEAAQALKVAFPDLKVGGPGFSPAGALTPNGQQFVRDFLDYVKNHNVPLDFLSWHLYANSPTDFVNVASFYKNLLDERGFANVETHVTEWNTATRDVSPDEAIALRTGARGAALMSAAWIELQNMGVDVATFYRGGDQGPDMTSGYGLFYADARPKKIALAFELWAELAAHPERLVLTPTPDSSLWGIAGRNAAGEIAVLVVNPHDTDTTYRFTDVNGQPLRQYAIRISEVNDNTPTTHVFTPTADVIPIGAYTVHLAVLSPAGEPEPTPTATPTATPPATGDAVIIPVGDIDPADPTVKPLLGVISGPDPNAGFTAPNLTTQYQDVGVFSVRNNDYYDDRLDMEGIFNCGGPTYPSWEGCDPNDDTYYNWGPSDAQFASYLNGGFDPFLRLGGEWQNGNHPHDFKGPQNATQEANWIIATQKVVDRYLHWNGVEKTFTYLDIWTEFPGDHFWDRSNVEFIAFWVRAYASLKGAYPQLKVGGPGFGAGETMKVIQGNAELSLALLTELYDQGLPLDWFGWHLFNNDPTVWTQAAIAYRQLLDGTGPYADVPWAGTGFFADTEVIVDAYGLSSRDADGSPLPPDERNQLHNGPRGASLLTAAWTAMQYADVERAYYYRGTDFGSSSPGDGSGGPGLFYSDAAGTYKPSAHAFRLWSQVYQRYPHLLQVTLPSADLQVPLWVLAARNDQGDIALLAANPSADAVTWSPRFADGTTLTDYAQVELYQVDGTNDGRTSTPFTGSAVTTAGYIVQLLVLHPAGNPQIGLNFIRFFWAPPGEPDLTTPYVQPGWIFNDFAELGIHTFRQFIWADLLWNIVEPQDDEWNFDQADAVIANPDFEPIVTLFRLQYASATPPWAADPSEFRKTLGPEAMDYLETIIERYGPYVKYWEIGNEMDHWRAADPDAVNPNPPNLPPSYPLDGFSPQEQGVFLAQVAAFIRERDPDAVIIMPGMGGLDDYTLNTWFAGVIEGGGTDWFDVVNYHYYPGWQVYGRRRQDLQAFLEEHDIAGKPVWLTETGSTASPTLTIRTDYPNSPESQAADVFRRLIQAYGYGDSLAIWHTYIGSPDTPGNDWRLYGIRTDTAEAQPSYYTFKLLTTELIPFASVEILSNVPAGENSFRITTEAGDVKYVAWGSGNFTVPAGVTQMASVIPNADGSFTWQAVGAGDVVTLAPEPVLLK